MSIQFIAGLFTLSAFLAPNAQADQASDRPEIRYKANSVPGAAVEQLSDLVDDANISIDLLRTTVGDAIKLIPPDWSAHARLTTALEESARAGSDPLVVLRPVVIRVARDLAFRPVNEAETPAGWPPYTPPGEVELKQYPLYRMAIVDESSKLPPRAFFFTLFGHIQKNEIAMTAPVEMEMNRENSATEMQSMAFLYREATIGNLGTDGSVKVIDVQPYLAVTVGIRGESNRAGLTEANALLEYWLTENADRYEKVDEAGGASRYLGYNGPGTPAASKYFELQVRVRRK